MFVSFLMAKIAMYDCLVCDLRCHTDLRLCFVQMILGEEKTEEWGCSLLHSHHWQCRQSCLRGLRKQQVNVFIFLHGHVIHQFNTASYHCSANDTQSHVSFSPEIVPIWTPCGAAVPPSKTWWPLTSCSCSWPSTVGAEGRSSFSFSILVQRSPARFII